MINKVLTPLIAAVIGAIFQKWLDLLTPLLEMLRTTLTFHSALTLILGLLIALLISLLVNLVQWSERRRPLGEKYRFEDKRGYNVDSKGRPLCPVCLRDGNVSRLAMRPPDIGYCNACQNTSKGTI